MSYEEARQLGHNYVSTEHLLLGLLREEEGVGYRVLENLGIDLRKVRVQVIRKMSEYQPQGESASNFLKDDLTGLVDEIDLLIARLNSALETASLMSRHIKGRIHDRVLSCINIADLLAQLPDSPDSEQPGLKELLTQLHALVEANANLQPASKAEMLEQLKILAEVGQNLADRRIQRFAKTAIRILRGMMVELPADDSFVEECQPLLGAIAQQFSFDLKK
ncbi:Clp protease N-terminal domain-containing protein [Kovacikia minuta]|uniref:Clp protease N-terminal domain-containing protein n=1 Tax=Kovacikia minuta TaxID=2931930 RepID=UPI0036F2B074